MSTQSDDRLLTAGEVAALLQVSPRFVYEHADRSEPKIPCVRLGAAVRFRPSAVRQWIEELERGA